MVDIFRRQDPAGMTGAAVVVAVIIGALYVGRDIFVPIALAILLSFALAPWCAACSAGAWRAAWQSASLWRLPLRVFLPWVA